MFVLNNKKGDYKVKYKYLEKDDIYEEKKSNILAFLYNTVIGRIVLKFLTLNIFSRFVSVILNSRLSKPMIKRYINKYSIDITKFQKEKYKSFNDFFKRKLIDNINESEKDDFIATANSKMSFYEISENLIINIKKSRYELKELIKDEEISREYVGGICLIYRLSPSDYHRYIFCDNGTQEIVKKINGKLHTVNPIIYDKYKVFSENYREVSILKTENFGEIVQIEVGALCVGKIVNLDIEKYQKYDEKGYFEFGGSTIIQLIKKDKVKIDSRIIDNTKNDIETIVDIGEIIGCKANNKS